ncbi:Type 1 glutamine amidotransferase-like domain-containing protein [Maledivibacter halophilus]|uniref:Peptidase E n=1 Tax=Maledivibacter halophilus TaxID=36842 RepID=A0A1T5M180_9FIRM|nr:Type 1 glutamine amidotransferase-like domain-containing protein [Maledivibacter halophilus]SKC81873.1 Peptidase E [Maledivibacter halophilus]
MRYIFAIGGGEISELETFGIDKKIVEAAKKAKPNVLFIPTASGEPQGYIDSFNNVYGKKLGCKTDVLLLLEGKILCGLSAGSICWFKSGHGDSESFETEGKWNYIRVEGINLLDAMHCPHYNEDNREEDFSKKILEYDEIGIAIDNNCAIEFKENSYRVHKTEKEAKAYKVYLDKGQIIKEELVNITEYKSVKRVVL